MSLSILIVNWNSKDYLRDCLKSILSTCEDLVTQIIVVDGGSFDGCDEMLRKEFSSVSFIQSNENLGFGKSNNLGFCQVTSDYVFLLNPDTELKTNALQIMLRTIDEQADIGMVGAKLLNSDGSLQHSCVQSFPTPINQAFDSNFLRKSFPKSKLWGTYPALYIDESSEVEAISGAAILMRSKLFCELGGFDKRYFMYGEDIDLCQRVRQKGLRVLYQPQAIIVHHGGGSSTGEFSKFSTVFMRQSIYSFISEHQGTIYALLFRVFMGISASIRVCLLFASQFLSSSEKKSKIRSSLNKWGSIFSWAIGQEKWTKTYL